MNQRSQPSHQACGYTFRSTRLVRPDAPPGGNGITWELAYSDLQTALASGAPEIWLAAGVYTPGPAGGDRDSTFQLSGELAVIGSFVGSTGRSTERDPSAATILSGDLNNDDETVGTAENAYHVVTAAAESSVTLEALTITGGLADGTGVDATGAGILAHNNSRVELIGVTLRNNTSVGDGGGYNGPSLIVRGSTLTHNTSTSGGGGAIKATKVEIYESLLTQNRAVWGAAAWAEDVSPGSKFIASRFIANVATGDHTAPYTPAIVLGQIDMRNCVVIGNEGMTVLSGRDYGRRQLPGTPVGQVWILSSTFANNSADAVIFRPCYNNGVVRNSYIGGLGGGVSIQSGSCGCPSGSPCSGAPLDVMFSAIEGGYPEGQNVLDVSPQFVSLFGADGVPGTEDDDLRLQANSPLIDAGTNTLPSGVVAAEADLWGNPRYCDSPTIPDTGEGTAPIIDIGAYEWCQN